MKFLTLLILLTLPVFGQDAPPTRIVTRTRTVAIFSDLEQKLMTAVQKKDKATLTDLSTDDFELRRSSRPGAPVPRDEWITNELPGYELRKFRIVDMAVHLFEDRVATVSMNYWQDATVSGNDRSGSFFVVDVWTKNGPGWKLAVRYVSPAEKQEEVGDRKPTGKE